MKATKRNAVRMIACVMAAMLLVLAGCQQTGAGDPDPTTSASATTAGAAPTQGASATDVPTTDGISYPLDTDITLSWFVSRNHSTAYAGFEESPFHIGLQEKTGVTIQWSTPVSGQTSEQAFNLLIASDEIPDMIMYGGWSSQAKPMMDDGYIIPLNDLIQTNAPDFYAILEENPEYQLAVKTDDGDIYMFPFLREEEWQTVYQGYVTRKDWLDAQNLEVPTTLAEIENMLRVLKDAYGAVFSYNPTGGMSTNGLWGAYDMRRDYFIDESGKVQYGPYLNAYKDALALLNRWYDEGLLDPEFATLDENMCQAKAMNDQLSLTYVATSGITKFVNNAEQLNSGAEWIGLPYPTLEKGDTIRYTHRALMPDGNKGAAITTRCQNPELAAQFLNYGYNEEGLVYWNYGKEGVSFEYNNDGVARFTTLVTEDAMGLNEGLNKYVGSMDSFPTVQLANYNSQFAVPKSMEAIDVWFGSGTDVASSLFPPVSPTVAEANEVSALTNAIKTYMDEMTFKFILGEESLEGFSAYQDQLKEMGIERVLEIKQQQYDRYIAR